MSGDPVTRVDEAAKQCHIAHDQLTDQADTPIPDEVVAEIGDIGERLRRIRHALPEGSVDG